MIFDITTFTLIHVGLSLVGIIAGLVVAGGLVAGRRLDGFGPTASGSSRRAESAAPA
jgi:hypothetical protein